MRDEMKKYVNETYDYLHSIPEVGWQEFKTSKFVVDELNKFGYEVIENVGSPTGVIGILDSGKEGPVFAIRADMDALEFEGEEGKYAVHACGHDAHTTMALAAGKNIIEKGIKKGKLYLVFQPAEEVLGGAISMAESGLLDEVEEMTGIHLRPKVETGLGTATPALVHSSSYFMKFKIKGLNAHGARPHLGINVIDAAAQLVNSINALHFDPAVPHSIKVTKLKAGGETTNLIPDTAEIAIDIRSATNEVMEEMLEKTKKVIHDSVEFLGAKIEMDMIGGVPAAEYDDELVEETRKAIVEVLGESKGPIYTVGGEDFHYFSKLKGIKTSYIGIGCDLEPGLHNVDMHFNIEGLYDGVDILEKVVENKLG